MYDQQMSATGVVRPVKSKAKVECWPVCKQPSYLRATVLYGASRSNLSQLHSVTPVYVGLYFDP